MAQVVHVLYAIGRQILPSTPHAGRLLQDRPNTRFGDQDDPARMIRCDQQFIADV